MDWALLRVIFWAICNNFLLYLFYLFFYFYPFFHLTRFSLFWPILDFYLMFMILSFFYDLFLFVWCFRFILCSKTNWVTIFKEYLKFLSILYFNTYKNNSITIICFHLCIWFLNALHDIQIIIICFLVFWVACVNALYFFIVTKQTCFVMYLNYKPKHL